MMRKEKLCRQAILIVIISVPKPKSKRRTIRFKLFVDLRSLQDAGVRCFIIVIGMSLTTERAQRDGIKIDAWPHLSFTKVDPSNCLGRGGGICGSKLNAI
jgi:hypothetical protein